MSVRWSQVLYAESSCQTMAAAAAGTSARRAGKTWCAFTRHLLEAGSLFVRLTPPDDDPHWRHNALMLAPHETARQGSTLVYDSPIDSRNEGLNYSRFDLRLTRPPGRASH